MVVHLHANEAHFHRPQEFFSADLEWLVYSLLKVQIVLQKSYNSSTQYVHTCSTCHAMPGSGVEGGEGSTVVRTHAGTRLSKSNI